MASVRGVYRESRTESPNQSKKDALRQDRGGPNRVGESLYELT